MPQTHTRNPKWDQVDALRAQAEALAQEIIEEDRAAERARPLLDRLCFAAAARCDCGAGLAYDPVGESGLGDPNGVFKVGGGYWECSAILLGTADSSVKHSARLPFAFYEVKSEDQPSAYGQTTRPDAR